MSLALFPVAFVVVAIAGCAWTERDSSSGPTRLFLPGVFQLTVVDVDAERAEVHELPELGPGDPSYHIVRRGDKLVLWGLAGDTYVLDPDLRSPPEKLADSSFFIPSAEPDRVWVAVRDSDPGPVRAPETLRELAIDGSVTFPDVHRPSQWGPYAAVGDELVFGDQRDGLELWNPRSGEITRQLPGATVGPTQGDLLAWCERDGHALHVLDVRRDRDRTIAPPPGLIAFDCPAGAFSPDGEALAIAARAGRYDADRSLSLVDVASGVAETIAGSTVGTQYVFVAWSSTGDRLFMSGARDDGRQLLQYRLGEPRAVPLRIEVRDFYGMTAT